MRNYNIFALVLVIVAGAAYFFREPIINAATSLKDKVVGLVSAPTESTQVAIIPATPSPSATLIPQPLLTPIPQIGVSPSLPQAGSSEDVSISLVIGVASALGGWYMQSKRDVKRAVQKIYIQ